MRDLFQFAAAALIALATPAFAEPYSVGWWVGMSIAAALAAYSAGHLFFTRLKQGAPLEPTHLVLVGLAGVIVFAILALVACIWGIYRSDLTANDREFATSLTIFIGGPLADAESRLTGVFFNINNTDNGKSGDAAFFAMEAMKNGLIRSFYLLKDKSATTPTSKDDVAQLRNNTIWFLGVYKQSYEYVPRFVSLTGVRPKDNIRSWLEADKDGFSSLRAIKIQFPELAKTIPSGIFASETGVVNHLAESPNGQ